MQYGADLLGHVTTDIKGSTDALQLRDLNLLESRVVGDLQVLADLSKERERQVAHLVVADNGKSLGNLCQVGCGERLKTAGVDTERAVELCEGGEGDGSDGTEGQVGGPDEVGQLNLNLLVVVGKVKRVGDVAQLHLDLVDVRVVGNLDGIGHDDVDALEGAHTGVLNGDLLGRLDGCGEANVLQDGQSVPLDGADVLQDGEVDAAQGSQAVEVHLARDVNKVAGSDTLDVRVCWRNQVAGQVLDAANGDILGGASCNGDAAGEGRAGGHGGNVALVLDGGGR